MPAYRTVALACLLALAGLASSANAGYARTEQAPYVGNNDVLRLTEFDNVCVGGPHSLHAMDEVAGACFQPRATDSHVKIRIFDRTGLPVGGFFAFHTRSGAYVTGRFCGETAANVPSDTWTLSVVVDGALTGPYDCAPFAGDNVGIGTSGSIYATFT